MFSNMELSTSNKVPQNERLNYLIIRSCLQKYKKCRFVFYSTVIVRWCSMKL